MNWQLAISRNREALLTFVVALMQRLGVIDGGHLTTLPNYLYRKTLIILRQAEFAVRRLIVIAAHEMRLSGLRQQKIRPTATNFALLKPRSEDKILTFNLIDPLKDHSSDMPDFDIYNVATKTNSAAIDHTPVPAVSLGRRLLALKKALDSIPHQAKRLVRWYAARDLALKQMRPHRLSPLRPGPPPASRRRHINELSEILRECHSLAVYARERHGTS